MKIALVHDSVLPVRGYGGIERVIVSLARDYTALGHHVVVASRAGSRIEGCEMIEVPSEIYNSANWWTSLRQRLPLDLDFAHFHEPVRSEPDVPYLVTIHGNARRGERFTANTSFVSRSHAANHNGSLFVYNGINPSAYPFLEANQKAEHFVFLAKASWSVKNLASAIAFANHHRVPLEVIGGTGRNTKYVTYRGFIGEAEGKLEILSRARALLYPTNWHEPFGIAVIEALACGTPVIASCNGAMPEILVPEGQPRAGVIARNFQDFTAAKDQLNELRSLDLRTRVESAFTTKLMAQGYLNLYRRVLNREFSNFNPGDVPCYTSRLDRRSASLKLIRPPLPLRALELSRSLLGSKLL